MNDLVKQLIEKLAGFSEYLGGLHGAAHSESGQAKWDEIEALCERIAESL